MEQNKMGVMPVGKLLISMSVPAMFSMLIQALYNVVDPVYLTVVIIGILKSSSLSINA